MSTSFSILDYSIVVAYLVATVGLGLSFASRQKSVEEYFVANRSASWWVVSLSTIATGLSAITFLGTPAWVFSHDLQYDLAGALLLPLVMWLVLKWFVPLLANAQMLTIYEYLEHRFSLTVRTVASLQFLLVRGGWLATATYAQSLLLAQLSGQSLEVCIAFSMVLTGSYTIFGGMDAVLWTDVVQFFVLVGGAIAIFVVVAIDFGGDLQTIWRIASDAGRTRVFNGDWDPTVEITTVALVANLIVVNLATYGSDQILVQRYLTSRSPKDMRWSLMATGVLTIPVVGILALDGLALYSYYHVHPELLKTLPKSDDVVPHFIQNVMPTGARGLVVAGILAASMSTLSAGFNSLGTATVVDIYQRLLRSRSNLSGVSVRGARLTTFAWMLLCGIAALGVGRLGSLVKIMGKITGFMVGPILGLFLLGILTKQTNSSGALVGVFCGSVAASAVSTTTVSWLWYAPVSGLVTMLLGYAASFLFRPDGSQQLAAVPSVSIHVD